MTDASNSMDYFRVLPENVNSYLEKGFIVYQQQCIKCKRNKPLCNYHKNFIKCKECVKDHNRDYYQKNKDQLKDKQCIDRRRKVQKEWFKKRYNSDHNFKLRVSLRNRINLVIKTGKKYHTSMELIGADLHEVRNYLEKKFQPGMNWDNHGLWHIDHIIPCAAFDLTKEEEQKRCFHYTNLQPLWARDNIIKSCRY